MIATLIGSPDEYDKMSDAMKRLLSKQRPECPWCSDPRAEGYDCYVHCKCVCHREEY